MKLAIWLAIPLLVLTASRAAAEQPGCNEQQIELTFDARTGQWSDITGNCRKFVTFDDQRRPKVKAKRDQKIKVRIIGVNPLLYSARFGEVTLTPIAAEKDLQSLLGLLGSIVSTAAQPMVTGGGSEGCTGGPLIEALAPLRKSLLKLDADRMLLLAAAQALEFEGATANVNAPEVARDLLLRQFAAVRNAVTHHPTDDCIDEVTKVLDKQGDVVKALSLLLVAVEMACEQTSNDPAARCTAHDLKGHTFQLRRKIRMPDLVLATPWNRTATYPIKVAQDYLSPAIATRLPKEMSTSLTIQDARATRLDVSVGILNVFSREAQRATWIVAPTPDDPSRKVVTKSTADSFVGVPSLIASYEFPPWACCGFRVELGSSLNTAKPAGFVGAGFSVFSSLRVGFGIAAIRIPKLVGDGPQEEASASTDQIKTKQVWTFEHPDEGWKKLNWYVSLSLSFSGLSLFNR
jgi:hypothetical protein